MALFCVRSQIDNLFAEIKLRRRLILQWKIWNFYMEVEEHLMNGEAISIGDIEQEMLLPRARDYLDIESNIIRLCFYMEAGINQLESRINILKREFQFSNDRNPI